MTSRKRILFVTDALEGAAAAQLRLLAAGVAHEYDVHVCVLGRGGPLEAAWAASAAGLYCLARRGPCDFQAQWRLCRLIRRLRPDIIHTWTMPGLLHGYAAARACGRRRIVATLRRGELRESLWQTGLLPGIIQRQARKHGSLLVLHGPDASHAADRRVADGGSGGTFRAVRDGVAPPPPAATLRPQWLAALGLPHESRLVGVTAPFRRAERIKDAIWAADLLKRIRDDVHLLLAGDGPQRLRLLRYRGQVQIGDKVHILGPQATAAAWLPHCDVFWCPGGEEHNAPAILEAIVAGVPVVAADTPVTRQLLAHGATAFLAARGHRAAFARWTNNLLNDRELAQRLACAARQRALAEFSAEAMIGQYRQIYAEFLGS